MSEDSIKVSPPEDSIHISPLEESTQTPPPETVETHIDEQSALDARSVYVGNVDYAATPEQLEKIFSKVGVVEKVTILVHRHTSFSKGYAYIAFKEQESVARAIEELNDTLLRSRPLKVHQKVSTVLGKFGGRERGSARGRGRGSFRGRGRARGRGRGKGGSHSGENLSMNAQGNATSFVESG